MPCEMAQMNYVAFQPAFDVFHTSFRFLRLRRLMETNDPWHYDQLRIADFYLLFFFRLRDVRLKPTDRSIRRLAIELSGHRYERQPSDQIVFNRMERIQRAAIGTLTINGFFESEPLKSGYVAETGKVEPDALAMRIEAINQHEIKLLEAVQRLITDYNLLGPDGLKARTGLLEHKYDAV
jgi:hypothetical protein